MRVLFGPWSCLLGLTLCLVSSLFPLGLSLNVAFCSRACLLRNLGRSPWLTIGSPLFGVMESPVMSSLILPLTGMAPLLLTPSVSVLVVAAGRLRYLRMTPIPCLWGVLGMWICSLTPCPFWMVLGLC